MTHRSFHPSGSLPSGLATMSAKDVVTPGKTNPLFYSELGIDQDEESLKRHVAAMQDPLKYGGERTKALKSAADSLQPGFAEMYKQLKAAKYTDDEARTVAMQYAKEAFAHKFKYINAVWPATNMPVDLHDRLGHGSAGKEAPTRVTGVPQGATKAEVTDPTTVGV